MYTDPHPDRFEVINGPEDGAEYPLTRVKMDLGSAQECAVQLRLDPKVRPRHALVSVVSGGYRIRRVEGTPVYVNGKRTGVVRSRIIRKGGVLQIGETELYLHCTEDGLASRSQGLVSDSDLGWILRLFFGHAAATLSRALRLGRIVMGKAFLPIAVILTFFLLHFFWPALAYRIWYFGLGVFFWIGRFFQQLFNQFFG